MIDLTVSEIKKLKENGIVITANVPSVSYLDFVGDEEFNDSTAIENWKEVNSEYVDDDVTYTLYKDDKMLQHAIQCNEDDIHEYIKKNL